MTEFGPVTFPAYGGANSGLRSLTDRILADRLRMSGQALVTSASANALPGEPAQTVAVVSTVAGAFTCLAVARLTDRLARAEPSTVR